MIRIISTVRIIILFGEKEKKRSSRISLPREGRIVFFFFFFFFFASNNRGDVPFAHACLENVSPVRVSRSKSRMRNGERGKRASKRGRVLDLSDNFEILVETVFPGWVQEIIVH